MENLDLRELLKRLHSEQRFDLIYGSQRENIEKALDCKVLTMPLDQMGQMPSETPCYLVTDRQKGISFLAMLQPLQTQ